MRKPQGRESYVSRKLKIDLPPDIWDQIDATARLQRRSQSDEIAVALTERYMPPEPPPPKRPPGRPRLVQEPPAAVMPPGDIIGSGLDKLPAKETNRSVLDELVQLEKRDLVQRTFATEFSEGSGYNGVYLHGRKYRAVIWTGGRGKRKILGTYPTPEQAAVARGRYLDAEGAKKHEEALVDEIRFNTVFRTELVMHPAWEYWIQVECMAEGVDKLPPPPFEPGVRYTVDPVTLAVTRDADGAVIIGPNDSPGQYRSRRVAPLGPDEG